MDQLKGKTVVVTGAARGLGQAFAEACALSGARVVICDVLLELATAVGEAIKRNGGNVVVYPLNVAEPASIERFAAALTTDLGFIDGLVNNAAIATGIGGKLYDEIDIDTWDRVMRVNVRGPWLVTKALVPLMKGRGSIVNISSDTALWGAPRLLHYVASKGAIISMTRSLARELGPSNISVNALAVGLTRVEATEYVPKDRHDFYEEGRAIRRPQYPKDVVGSVVFLLSDAAAFITGQVLAVNGGLVLH